MANISDKLNTIKNAKENIKSSIEAKGVSVGDVSIEEYSSKIDEIEAAWDSSQLRNCSTMFQGNQEMIEAPYFDTSNVESMSAMFFNCTKLNYIPKYNTSKVTNMQSMVTQCAALIEFPALDTSNVTKMGSMFNNCSALTTVPQLDASKVIDVSYIFASCSKMINLGGFLNLGKAYTQKSNNHYWHTLDLSNHKNLTHESLMNVINGLYDLNLTYNVANGGTLYTQSLKIGSTNLAKLTAEEIAIATNKGWNVS